MRFGQKSRCHGLVPWSFTLVAIRAIISAADATGLSRRASRSASMRCKRETPRGEPVASDNSWPAWLATSVRLHGTSSWHLDNSSPVWLATNVKHHGPSPWHLRILSKASLVKNARISRRLGREDITENLEYRRRFVSGLCQLTVRLFFLHGERGCWDKKVLLRNSLQTRNTDLHNER